MSEDTISYYLKLNNVAYVTLHEILTSKQTWVGALNFLTCSRNDKNINLCITRAAATLLRMALQALCPSFNTNLFGNQVTSDSKIRTRTSAKISRKNSPSCLGLVIWVTFCVRNCFGNRIVLRVLGQDVKWNFKLNYILMCLQCKQVLSSAMLWGSPFYPCFFW